MEISLDSLHFRFFFSVMMKSILIVIGAIAFLWPSDVEGTQYYRVFFFCFLFRLLNDYVLILYTLSVYRSIIHTYIFSLLLQLLVADTRLYKPLFGPSVPPSVKNHFLRFSAPAHPSAINAAVYTRLVFCPLL